MPDAIVSRATLDARGLCVRLAGRDVLRSIDLSIAPGEIVGILGPNGGGKTTLLRTLAGVLRASAGEVTLAGTDLHAMPHRERARRIALIAQSPEVAFSFSVRQVVALGGYAGARATPDRVKAALERVTLADRADDPFAELSAGQRQRAALARALVQLESAHTREGQFLLADEPFAAMDPRFALASAEILRSLAAQGVAVAIVIHDLALASRLCDRAILLAGDGRVRDEGPIEHVLRGDRLGQAFGVRFRVLDAMPGVVPIPEILPHPSPTTPPQPSVRE